MSPRLTDQNLAMRRERIGASEVACLLPCGSPWMTKADLYARIVHGVQRSGSQAAEMGHELEATVLRLAADRMGVKVRANRRTWAHPTLPLAATPDALVVGKPELVEVKVVSHWASEEWQDGPPPHVMAQVQAQMLCSGRSLVTVASLHEGSRLLLHDVPADMGWHAAIWDAVADFWSDHVLPRIPPPEVTPELVLTVTATAGSVAATGDLLEYGDLLAERVQLREWSTTKEEEARGALALSMAAHGVSLVVGPTWSAEAVKRKNGMTTLTFTRKRTKEEAAA